MSSPLHPFSGLKGKKALVTGAASGIGRETARLLSYYGCEITLGDINETGLQDTASLLSIPHKIFQYNAMDETACEALVSAASEDGLDIVCNIAGLLDWGLTAEFDTTRFLRVLNINLASTFTICRAAYPHLLKTQGVIVNTASTAALVGIPYSAAYTASKHGVAGLTKSLAVEWASDNVRVNAICPGHVNTPMGQKPPPAGDIDWSKVMRNTPKLPEGTLTSEEVATQIIWLAAEPSKKMTGTVLALDAGQTAG